MPSWERACCLRLRYSGGLKTRSRVWNTLPQCLGGRLPLGGSCRKVECLVWYHTKSQAPGSSGSKGRVVRGLTLPDQESYCLKDTAETKYQACGWHGILPPGLTPGCMCWILGESESWPRPAKSLDIHSLLSPLPYSLVNCQPGPVTTETHTLNCTPTSVCCQAGLEALSPILLNHGISTVSLPPTSFPGCWLAKQSQSTEVHLQELYPNVCDCLAGLMSPSLNPPNHMTSIALSSHGKVNCWKGSLSTENSRETEYVPQVSPSQCRTQCSVYFPHYLMHSWFIWCLDSC
jgi:hypothetical protein